MEEKKGGTKGWQGRRQGHEVQVGREDMKRLLSLDAAHPLHEEGRCTMQE